MLIVNQVSKSFGSKQVLNNVSFSVADAAIHGYLGHNASGKTTTIKIMLGLLKATAGSVRVFGEDISKKPEIKNQIGYVSEEVGLYSSVSARDNLIRFCHLYGLEDNVDQVIEDFELQEFANIKVKKLSKGTKQRVAIARAFLGSPKLLILDEPTSNLDPIQRYKLKENLRKLRARGVSTFIATHILSDVEEVCDAITIIKNGRILFSGSFSDLHREVPLNGLTVQVSTSNNDEALRLLSKEYTVSNSGKDQLAVAVKEKADIANISRVIDKLDIYEIKPIEPSLEALYKYLDGTKNE